MSACYLAAIDSECALDFHLVVLAVLLVVVVVVGLVAAVAAAAAAAAAVFLRVFVSLVSSV